MDVVFSVTGRLMRIPAGATQWEDVSVDCFVSLAQLKLRAHLPDGAKILADDISAAAFRHRQSGKKVQWSVSGQEAYYLHCRSQEDADQFANVLESARGVSSIMTGRRLKAYICFNSAWYILMHLATKLLLSSNCAAQRSELKLVLELKRRT
jgi:hypothetical protein